jgi:hypothetical protein
MDVSLLCSALPPSKPMVIVFDSFAVDGDAVELEGYIDFQAYAHNSVLLDDLT